MSHITIHVNLLSHSSLCTHLSSIISTFVLTQVVQEPTHIGHNNISSLIELVFMSAPQTLAECAIVLPLLHSGNTSRYHLGVSLKVNCCSNITQPWHKRRVIWSYNLADFQKASQLPCLLTLILAPLETGFSMGTCIRKSTLPERSVPWMTKAIVQAIRKRNYFYRRAKKN